MRRQRPRGTITREAVVSAALSLADEAGIDALTIRAVARLVGAPPMSLYTHFANKQGLLDLMYSELARRLYADNQHPTWQSELLALCRQVRAVLLEHPRWIPLLSRPAPPLDVPLRERLLRLMVDDGMLPEFALAALTSAILISIGLVLAEVTFREADGHSSLAKRFSRRRTWVEGAESANGKHPLMLDALSKLRRPDLSDNFTLAVNTFIAGLEVNRSRANQ
jgi:AcrR family transcriptional regulator